MSDNIWYLSIVISSLEQENCLNCKLESASQNLPFLRESNPIKKEGKKSKVLVDEFQECNFDPGWWFYRNQIPINEALVIPTKGLLKYKILYQDGEETVTVHESKLEEFDFYLWGIGVDGIVHVEKDLLHMPTDHLVFFCEESRIRGVKLFVPEGKLPTKFTEDTNIAKELQEMNKKISKRKVKFARHDLIKELRIDLSLPPSSNPSSLSDSSILQSESTSPKPALRSPPLSPVSNIKLSPLNTEYDAVVSIITEINKNGYYIDSLTGTQINSENLSEEQLVSVAKKIVEENGEFSRQHLINRILMEEDKYDVLSYRPQQSKNRKKLIDVEKANLMSNRRKALGHGVKAGKDEVALMRDRNLESSDRDGKFSKVNMGRSFKKPTFGSVFSLAFYRYLEKLQNDPAQAIFSAFNVLGYLNSKNLRRKGRTLAWPLFFFMLVVTSSINNVFTFRTFKGIFGHGIQTLPHL